MAHCKHTNKRKKRKKRRSDHGTSAQNASWFKKEEEWSKSTKKNSYDQGRGWGWGRGYRYGRGWRPSENNNQRGKIPQRGHGRGSPKLRYDKSRIKCYNCERFGHYAFECRATKNNKVKEKVNYVKEKNQEDGTLLLAYKDNKRVKDSQWLFKKKNLGIFSKRKFTSFQKFQEV